MLKRCKLCDKEFDGHFKSTYCSENCRKIGLRNNRKEYSFRVKNNEKLKKICPCCNNVFTPHGRQIFCSLECSNKIRNGNKHFNPDTITIINNKYKVVVGYKWTKYYFGEYDNIEQAKSVINESNKHKNIGDFIEWFDRDYRSKYKT